MGEENDAPPTGPLSERLVHKTWKWRLQAYEELENMFKLAEDGNGPIFNEYAPIFKKILADTNPAAQEKGLDTLLAFIDRCDSVPKHAGSFVPLLVDKCFPAARAKTKEKAVEALLKLIEADSPEPVVEGLLAGASNKVPKISAASISTLREALRLFGAKVVSPKPIMKVFPSWFENRDKGVREEASKLVVELYRWIGKALTPTLESLTGVQAKELQEAFEKLPNEPTAPVKYMRSQAPKPGQVVAAVGKAAAPEVIDPYDLMSEVNILSKIKDEFFTGLSSAKWQERNEQLEKLIEMTNVPRLEQGDYSEVAKALKKALGDANIVVVSKAAKAASLLGNGLRMGFSAHAKVLLPSLLEKLKEKKPVVMNAINEALDSFAANCFILGEVMEDILKLIHIQMWPFILLDITAAVANKVPQVREGTLNWLAKAVVIPKQAHQIMKILKPLCAIFITALDDGAGEVRDAAAKSFGILAGVVGERAVSPYLAKLEPNKAKKVKDNFPQVMATAAPVAPVEEKEATESTKVVKKIKVDKADGEAVTTKSESVSARTSRVKATEEEQEKAPVPSARMKSEAEEAPKQAPAAPKKVAAKKPAAKAPATATAKASAKPGADKGKGKAKGPEEDLTPKMTKDEALAKASEILPATALTNLEDKNWKQRLAGIEELTAAITSMPEDALSEASDVILQQLDVKPGWKESNFQVLNGAVLLIAKIALADPKFSRRAAAIVLGSIAEKLADIKIKNAAIECLCNFTEATCPQFVFSQLYQHTAGHKNPKVTSEALLWMIKALEDFGCAGLDIKMLIDHLKGCLDSTNAPTKTAATKVLVVLRIAMGPGLSDFLGDVKKQLLDSIEKEFDKVKDAKPSPPTRTFREAVARGSGSSSGVIELPRSDISGKLTQKLLKDLGDAQWKTRQAALDQIEAIILEANRRVEPKLGSLMGLLKARLSDSNQKICTTTLYLIGMLAGAVGPAYDKSAKIVIPAVLTGLADNKKPMRDATLTTLDQVVIEVGLECFMSFLPAAMLLDSSLGRKEVLQWMMKYLPTFKPKAPAELKEFVKPLLACLQDKQGDVRHLAEAVLGETAKHIGVDVIKRECKDLKPASQQLVGPIIEKLRPVAPVAAAPSAQPAAPSLSSSQNSSLASSQNTVTAAPTATTTATSSKPVPAPKRTVPEDTSEKEKPERKPPVPSRTPTKTVQSSPAKPPARSPSRGSIKAEPSSPASAGSSCMLFSNTQKSARAANERKLTWAFDAPRQEFVAALSQQAQDVMSPVLHGKMFTSDYRAHFKAFDDLTALISANQQEVIDNLDIVLKWCTLRLFDPAANVKKCLQFLEALFVMLDVYPSSKMFKFVLEALKTKNWRTKVEALEEIGSLIQRNGLSVCNPPKVFPLIAANFADKDPLVTKATLSVFAQAYTCVGEELWSYLPSLTDSQRNNIEQHIRRTQAASDAATAASPARPASSMEVSSTTPPVTPTRSRSIGNLAATTSTLKSPRRAISPSPPTPTRASMSGTSASPSGSMPRSKSSDFKLEIEKLGAPRSSVIHKIPALAATDMPSHGNTTPRLPVRQDPAVIDPLEDDPSQPLPEGKLEAWLHYIDHADITDMTAIEDVLEVVKQLNLRVKQGTPLSDDSACDRILISLAGFVRKLLDLDTLHHRAFRYVMYLIVQISKDHALYSSVTRGALENVLRLVFTVAIDQQPEKFTDDDKKILHGSGKEFLKEGLEGCDIVVTFSVLLRLMSQYESKEFTDLAIRMYLRHIKRLSVSAALLDRSRTIQLLQDANAFLVALSSSSEADAPLRAVKSMLSELVKGQNQSELIDCASHIPAPAPVVTVIQHLIREKNMATSGTAPSEDDTSSLSIGATSFAIPSGVSSSLPSINEKRELQDIMRRAVNHETSKQGILELHSFRKAHPNVDIMAVIAQITTPAFQASLKRQLDAIENGDDSSNALEAADLYMEKLRDIQSRCGLTVSQQQQTQQTNSTQQTTQHNNQANLPVLEDIKKRIKSAGSAQPMDVDKENTSYTPQIITAQPTPMVTSSQTTADLTDIKLRLARMRNTAQL